MSATGIVMRQALGTPPVTSDAAWKYSPDILIFPDDQPGDLTLLTTLYGAPFAQAPDTTGANYIYVRGMNANAGPQTSTVYLFSVDSNPTAGIFDPLLDPSNWLSTGFAVNGKAQNSVSIQASAQNAVVLGASGFVWNPVAMSTSVDHYVLIAWVDNTGNNPPPFSTLQPFNDLDALRQYVEANSNMVLLDTAYSGMFARQNLGQSFNLSQPTSEPWQSSPDLVLYAGQPQFDPTLLVNATNWAFHQMPVPTQPNYLYVRGYNASGGALAATISFYYAEYNPGAGVNPVLDPKNWKTDSFTYGGAAQNSFTLNSPTPALFMTNTTPLIWTPAAPASGNQFCVFAWIDNTGGSNPPPFTGVAAFKDMNSLGEYIAGQRNLLFWNTSFDGLFLRQFPGQAVNTVGTGAQTSPDIVVSGPEAVQDASTFATAASYSSSTLNQNVSLGQRNFIYLRAINPNNAQQRARIYLYYAASSAISPPGWSPQGFTVAGATQNWVDLVADTLNQVMVTTVPVVWTAPTQVPVGGQFIFIAYVDGSDDPQPPDFSPFGYTQTAAVTQFVATEPKLSWLLLNSTTPRMTPTMSAEYPLPPPKAAANQFVGVQFLNIPSDGTFSVFVPGPDGADTIAQNAVSIPSSNAAVVWPVAYPANFQNSLVLNYYQGGTAPPNGANITLIILKS